MDGVGPTRRHHYRPRWDNGGKPRCPPHFSMKRHYDGFSEVGVGRVGWLQPVLGFDKVYEEIL